jgi:hypothetical protein
VLVYRAAFDRSEAGKAVLADLLESTGILRKIETEEQRVHHNWGVWLLENMAATQGMNYTELVEAILRLTIPDEAIVPEERK